jgi:hypothetical protein
MTTLYVATDCAVISDGSAGRPLRAISRAPALAEVRALEVRTDRRPVRCDLGVPASKVSGRFFRNISAETSLTGTAAAGPSFRRCPRRSADQSAPRCLPGRVSAHIGMIWGTKWPTRVRNCATITRSISFRTPGFYSWRQHASTICAAGDKPADSGRARMEAPQAERREGLMVPCRLSRLAARTDGTLPRDAGRRWRPSRLRRASRCRLSPRLSTGGRT